MHTDRLRQRPRAPKGHTAHQLPAAVPIAPGQAHTMATTGFSTVQSGWKGRRDTGQQEGNTPAGVHCNSTALPLPLEGKCTVPPVPWLESSHPVEEEAKARSGSPFTGSPFSLCLYPEQVQTSNGETHTITPPAMLNSEPG